MVNLLGASDFNPLPPCGGRHVFFTLDSVTHKFQSTPSVWRETLFVSGLRRVVEFQSTPSVWRETRLVQDMTGTVQFQSTPSVWRETISSRSNGVKFAISIHSLRVEGDSNLKTGKRYSAISIHSLRVEGDGRGKATSFRRFFISIHSLRVEGDRRSNQMVEGGFYFNPLPPCGGRQNAKSLSDQPTHFNPLPPCGGRLFMVATVVTGRQFQSTPSVWRETA